MKATSKAKIEANRRNAGKSTGPRTAEGKARASRNATTHKLFSRHVLMDSEGYLDEEFQVLFADLREEHQPDGPTEDILVYKMAESFFIFQRAASLLATYLDLNTPARDYSKQVALMMRYHTTAERAFNRNLHDLRKLQKERALENDGFVSQPVPTEPAKPIENRARTAAVGATQFNRDVAIELLPSAFAEDAARMTRFEREALVLASVKHPTSRQFTALSPAAS